MITAREVQVDGRPALLTVPADGPVEAGVVALHGSSNSSYRQVIFEHLADTLAPLGVAVLSFERAPWPRDDVDIPYAVQAAGAVAAYEVLKSHYDVPTGFWGVSQGTWVAALAAQQLPETLEVWRRAAATSGNTQVESVRIPGVGHWPGSADRSLEGISADYTEILRNWFTR